MVWILLVGLKHIKIMRLRFTFLQQYNHIRKNREKKHLSKWRLLSKTFDKQDH